MEDNFLKYMHEEDIIINLKTRNKKNAIIILVDRLINTGKVGKKDRKEIIKAITQRESMGSTAIGGNIALPHARLMCVKGVVVCIAISHDGIDFDSLDEEPVNIIVLLLSNQKEAGAHLKTLAHLAKMLREKSFIQQLKKAKEEKDVISLIVRNSMV